MQMSSQLRLFSPEIVASVKERGAVSEMGGILDISALYM